MIIKNPINSDIEDELDKINEEFNEFKSKLSDARKKSADTYFIDVRIQEYPALVKMVRVGYEEEAIEKLRSYIKKLKEDLEEAYKGEPFAHIMHLIREAYEHLRNAENEEARALYSRIMDYYRALSPDMRRIVYSACADLHDKINAGWSSDKDIEEILGVAHGRG